jgi:hypothetical protein
MKRMLLVVGILIIAPWLAHHCDAQKIIRLSKHTKQTFLIVEGDRVRCRLENGRRLIGVVQRITDSTFSIGGVAINFENVLALAKKKKGSNFFLVLVIGAGAAMIFTGSIHSQSELYLLASAESLLLIKPLHDRRWKDVKTKWDLEVIDTRTQNPKL